MFIKSRFINKKPKILTLKKNQPYLKKKISSNTIVLSDQIGHNTLFILYQGSLQYHFSWHENLLPILEITQAGYFGFESFLEKNHFYPSVITRENSVISAYPMSSVLSLIKKNRPTYISYINSLNQSIHQWAHFTNRMIQEINNLVVFNCFLVNLIDQAELNSSNLNYQDYLINNKIQEEEILSLSFLSDHLDSSFKHEPISARKNLLAVELFDPLIVNEVIPILIRKINSIKILNQDFFNDLEWVQHQLVLKIKLIAKEIENLFDSKNSFLKELSNQKNKIATKWHKVLRHLCEKIDEKIIQNQFLNNFIETQEMIHYLDFNFQSEIELVNLEVSDDQAKIQQDELSQPVEKESPTPEITDDIVTLSEIELIKEIASASQKELTVSQSKKLRKLNQKFIANLSRVSVKKFISNESLAPDEQLLISGGLLHKNFLTAKQFNFINQKIKNYKNSEHVISLEKWLEKIVGGESPSNDELGVSYRKYLFEEKRFLKNRKDEDQEEETETEKARKKMIYEVEHAIASNFKSVHFGRNNLYSLNQNSFPPHPEKILISAQQIEDLIQEIKGYDFSLFFRETLYTLNNDTKKLIDLEVLPLFIVLPTVGNRIICWQECSENNKKTPARFFVPLFFTEDFRKNFIEAIAFFRWEICRNVKGSSWQDSIKGGITGAYADYINFHKRNSSLSIEAKEKITKFVQDNRKNQKKMFSQNYYEWIEHERKGLIRFNSMLRELFFKHIPFGRKIRKEIKNLPSFEKIIPSFEIRRKNEKELLIKKYKKFLNQDGTLPKVLEQEIASFDL